MNFLIKLKLNTISQLRNGIFVPITAQSNFRNWNFTVECKYRIFYNFRQKKSK